MVGLVLTVISANVHAQVPKATKPAPPGAKMTVVFRGELGKWWQNSEIAKMLQLNDSQISQLDQIFYEHKLKLIDYGAEIEKQDLKLQTLLDADVPNDGQVEAQVDQVLAARGKLEREFTLMNLDLRKVLSLDQWRQLKSVRGEGGAFGDRIFYRKALPPGAGRDVGPLPPLPPSAPGGPNEMFQCGADVGCSSEPSRSFTHAKLACKRVSEKCMKFGVVIFPGSNCDHDAFWTIQHVAKQPVTFLWHESHDLENCDAIIVPCGFAYGDYLRTGAIAKFSPVMESVRKFAADGGLVLGICNGFQ